MTALIVIGCIVGYLTVGAFYARSRAVEVYRKAKAEWKYEDMVRVSVILMLLWRTAFWPYAVLFDGVRPGVAAWFMAPVAARRAKAVDLRAQADRYDALIAACDDPTDRALMRQGQQALLGLAREVDL